MRPIPLLLAVLAGCAPGDEDSGSDDPYNVQVGPYDVDIRWTTHGIPHVQATDYGSLGYGAGYAFAFDHGCVFADQLVKITGTRAKYFGEAFIDSDFGWRGLRPVEQAEEVWNSLDDTMRDTLVGYAAGYNRWVDEGNQPPACADAEWVRRITHIDVTAYALALVLDGSGNVFVNEVGQAAPPNAPSPPPAAPGPERLDQIGLELRDPKRGSNGWAIGKDRTANGKGMVLSNTHFPSIGEKQWYEWHLTIPGELDVYGVSLMGVPIVNMGFNAHVAWTHTVSYSPRFIGYFLTLDPTDPTRYLFDGSFRDMTSTVHTIEVADGNGGTREVSRELWRSHYGVVINAPIIGWSDSLAVTLRDVNAGNIAAFDTWFEMNTAKSMDEFIQAHRTHQGIPWVYTIAASEDGQAYFGDTSRVPYLSDKAISAWQDSLTAGGPTSLIASNFADFGVIGVDGSDPLYAWVDDPMAATPGIVPYDLAPTDLRTDYVFNANDSHWLHNAEAPLTGYPQALYGPEGTARSARTRMNGRYLSETGEGSASGADGKFTLAELEAAAMSMRSSIVEESKDAVVARCKGVTDVDMASDGVVDISEACALLEAWSGRYTTDAVGAIVWREMLGSGEFDLGDLNDGGGNLFETPFSVQDPLGTPRDVAPGPVGPDVETNDDRILRSIARAVLRLNAVGVDLDAKLGDVQEIVLGNPDAPTRVGVPGASYWEGTIGISDYSGGATSTLLPYWRRGELANVATELTTDGTYPMNNGNSWIMAMQFGDDGPEARAVMTYSQSEVWDSPNLADQTTIYSGGNLRDVAFTDAQIDAALVDEVNLTYAP